MLLTTQKEVQNASANLAPLRSRHRRVRNSLRASVVERVGKRPFREFMRGEVLNRLQMTSSGFNLTGRDVAIGYQLTRLPSGKRTDPSELPVNEEIRLLQRKPL
jgi:hypothetical protein